jgi:cold shock CspA family protein
MQRSVVKWYNPQMGYGIVTVANGRLVMVHAANLAAELHLPHHHAERRRRGCVTCKA